MPSSSLRVVFMGTPEFSVPALRMIADAGFDVVAVYSQPPRPKGRGQQVQKSPVHEAADLLGIPVFTPLSLKKDMDAQKQFAAHDADIAVVAAYGLILPQAVLDAPRYGCLNIHASLLPRWRGASPIQHAIWHGDAESGVGIMQMEAGLDTGPVIAQRAVPIRDTTTAQSLHDELSALGAALMVEILKKTQGEGRQAATAQDNTHATYAGLLTKDDGRVDWTRSAADIDRQVRALNPWPGVWTNDGAGKRVKIIAVAPGDTASAAAGTVIDRHGHVACGDGRSLRLVTVQPENAKAMDCAAAVNGKYIVPGTMLV